MRVGEELHFSEDEKLGHKLKVIPVLEFREPEAIMINILLANASHCSEHLLYVYYNPHNISTK